MARAVVTLPTVPPSLPLEATIAPAAPAPTETEGPPALDPGLRRTLREVSDAVSLVRGTKFVHSVMAKLVTREEMADYIAAHLDAEEQQDLAVLQELYWVLGLLDPSVELYPLYLELLGEQVAGLFDLDTEELLVVAESSPLDASGKFTLAHELVHALQQQRFDARRLADESEGNRDRELAVAALLEGDATLTSLLYAATGLTPSEVLQLTQEAGNLETPVFDRAPPVIKDTLLFPYEAGSEFVSYLQQGRGFWRPVNQAYSRPPVSTEQILHPAKYLADEAPKAVSLPPLLPLLEGGWELVFEDVLGEWLLRTYLNSALARPAASRAAGGWGGDQFRVLRDDSGRRLFVAVIVWDTDIDAREFFDAYQQFTDATGEWVTRERQGDHVRWHSLDRSVLLSLDQRRTLISIAPDKETIELIASYFPE